MLPAYNDPHEYDYVSDRCSGGKVTRNIVFRVIIAILAAVCVAFIAACHDINWASYTQDGMSPPEKSHVRMWRIAVENHGEGWYIAPEISATRAFMVIGLVCAVVALVLAIVYIVFRSANEDSRKKDDEEREAVRQEYLRRLQERRRLEEQAERDGKPNSSFVRNYEVCPPSHPSHPRSYYIDRENQRLFADWSVGLTLWIFLLFTMISMAIVIGCFMGFYNDDIKDMPDSELVVGFWLAVTTLIVSYAAVVIHVNPHTCGWNICIGRPKGRKVYKGQRH